MQRRNMIFDRKKLEKNGKPWAPRTVDTKGNIVYARKRMGLDFGLFRGSFGICIIYGR
jgi:hypothetical protein